MFTTSKVSMIELTTNFIAFFQFKPRGPRAMGPWADTIVSDNYVHFVQRVTLFVHDVTLEQNFMDLTFVVKIEIQDEIWTYNIF